MLATNIRDICAATDDFDASSPFGPALRSKNFITFATANVPGLDGCQLVGTQTGVGSVAPVNSATVDSNSVRGMRT